MTAYTSAQSGLFSANSTWTPNTGHPSVNGDTFSIVSPHVVTFDLDTSGLTLGFGASSVAAGASLIVSTGAGTYYNQMNGNLSGAGLYSANNGTGVAMPSTVTFTHFQRSGSITLTGAKDFISNQPTARWVKLTVAANAGDTVLSIGTDLTGAGNNSASQWVNGSLVNIDNVNKGLQTEQKTISSVTSTTLTLTAGLTNAKNVGSYIILLTRNVKVLALSTAVNLFSGANASDHFACEVRTFNTAFSGMSAAATFDGVYSNGLIAISGSGTGPSLSSGGVVTGCSTSGVNGSSRAAIASGALVSGCGFGMGFTGNAAISNRYSIAGTISGCSQGVYGTTSLNITGTIDGCGTALASCSGYLSSTAAITNNGTGLNDCDGVQIRGATFSGNTTDVAGSNGNFQAFNTSLTFSANTAVLQWQYQESINHGNVSGAYKAVGKSGTALDVASPVYDASRPRSYQIQGLNTVDWAFMQREELVPAGATLNVRCYVQKSGAIGAGTLPRLWINDAANEPLQSGSPDVEKIMTDSVNTWEVLTGTITNSTNSDKYYMVRFLVKSNAISTYFDPIIRVSGMMQPANMEGNLAA